MFLQSLVDVVSCETVASRTGRPLMRSFHPSTCLLFLLVVMGGDGCFRVENGRSSDPGGEFASWGFSCFKDMGVSSSSCKFPIEKDKGLV